MKATTLRIFTAIVAACGLLGCLIFAYRWAGGHAWRPYPMTTLFYIFGPYAVVAAAAGLARTGTLATIPLAASLAILALGVQTYISLARSGPDSINDITLHTLPLQQLISYSALVVSVAGFIAHKVTRAPTVALHPV